MPRFLKKCIFILWSILSLTSKLDLYQYPHDPFFLSFPLIIFSIWLSCPALRCLRFCWLRMAGKRETRRHRRDYFISQYKCIFDFIFTMSDKDIAKLTELANTRLEQAKAMSKKQAILSLNEAGILTKKGKFTQPYVELEEVVNK